MAPQGIHDGSFARPSEHALRGQKPKDINPRLRAVFVGKTELLGTTCGGYLSEVDTRILRIQLQAGSVGSCPARYSLPNHPILTPGSNETIVRIGKACDIRPIFRFGCRSVQIGSILQSGANRLVGPAVRW